MKIRQGDLVEVISGDDRGLRGRVRVVLPKKARVIVSGLNIVKRHTRPTGRVRTQAGIIEQEAPLHISNVALVCQRCDRPVRVKYDFTPEGEKVRVCGRCGELLQ